ncbi:MULTISPECIES: pirin family protein [unclassified Herbaspirillum]|uniref:pirin family protein n=1 Tax=unclassified Herbaspirillum TaxID=2624150 RepID=UPI00114F1FCA|nr:MULTISPECIES: pirin family protein [unclassified Herbaspirillum]MBB5393647.1 hypothetical protein [Herbaspirillum sp. SJZ102]TQK03607.1 hypothetical protein FB599_3166 [Herbaspirillum sp. SJZ130]TQK08339.1 hypothetical protein FB598_3105 [Herbaspirillum sp. SJZ106]TWC71602.1 hypothetical protein FB597_101577 [Herbaspirillum sp. SJZ099]
MIERRPFGSLGTARHDWLESKRHFSFARHHDPRRMHWGVLRAWNDDTIASGSGFLPQSQADMEIITYVHEGAITHKDSLGNMGRTAAGDVQVMSAGRGISHSEYNLEPGAARIFQIWILPSQQGALPSWGTKPFPKDERVCRFVPLASGANDDEDALPIRADARVLGTVVKAGETVSYRFADTGRYGYLVLAKGRADINGVPLEAQDGAAIHGEPEIAVTASEDAELVLVDAAGLA